jgi:hypothetical protein
MFGLHIAQVQPAVHGHRAVHRGGCAEGEGHPGERAGQLQAAGPGPLMRTAVCRC